MFYVIETLAANVMPLVFTLLGTIAMYLKVLIFKGDKVGMAAIFYIVLFRLYPSLMQYAVSYFICA